MTPNSLQQVKCEIMRFLRSNGQTTFGFFSDPELVKKSLDAEMKRLQSKGMVSKKHRLKKSELKKRICYGKKDC